MHIYIISGYLTSKEKEIAEFHRLGVAISEQFSRYRETVAML